MIKKLSIFSLLFFFLIQYLFIPSEYFSLSQNKEQKTPIWWEIVLHLTIDGEYKLEQKETSYQGNYSFTILWKGCMEADDLDYIIYHEDCRLQKWKAREKKVSFGSSQTKTSEDFREKPVFHFNYIIREKENLRFDFFMDEFSIPQNESTYQLSIFLPNSSDVSEPKSGISYESFITKGSNLILLKEEDIYLSNVSKEFAWNWIQQKWFPKSLIPTRFTNQHKVKVKVTTIPHYE